MKTDLFDFNLPPENIALRPVSPRDTARMLIVRTGEKPADRQVRDLPDMLEPGDVLVFNDTRVIPAQLTGRRGNATIGATLHKRIDLRRWQAFVRNAKRLKPEQDIDFGQGVIARAEERLDDGSFILYFAGDEPVEALLTRAGTMPLPPYIASRRAPDARDAADYQTRFAREDGAVAAPTAALHFTDRLMEQLTERGIVHEMLTLHVGAGTFLPVKAEDTSAHKMHSEWGPD